jgi:hypothetical protein
MNRIWNDGALKRLPLWLAITAMTTNVLLGLLVWREASRTHALQLSTPELLAILWLAIAIYFLGGNVRTRCQRLDLTLPIASRTLWWSHQWAVIIAGTLILAGSMAVIAATTFAINRVDPERALQGPYFTLAAPLLAGLALAAAMIGSLEPELWKLRGRKEYWIFVITGLAGILVILLLLDEKPWVATRFCLLMTAVITYLTWRKLPPAYRLVPKCAAPASETVSIAATSESPVSRWQVLKIVFDVLHTTPPWKQFTPWMLYFFVALMGFIIAGGLDRAMEAQSLRFMYIPMGSYMLLAGCGLLTYHLFRFDSLPISRRTLFAVLVLPGILIFLMGYLVGQLLLATDPAPTPLVDYHVEKPRVTIDLQQGSRAEPAEVPTMVWVEVDQAFMGVSLTGEPPILSAPWGESHQAWSTELFRGLPPVLYNPYNTTETTSADFEALMASRALQDIYGESIPPQVIREQFFVVEDDQVVGLGNPAVQGQDAPATLPLHAFSQLEDQMGRPPLAKGPEAAIYLALVLVPALLLTAFFIRSFRAHHSNRYIRAMYWIGLGLLLGALIGQAVLAALGVFDPEAGRGFLAVFIHRLGGSPISWILTWVVSLGAIFASYRVALAQFERAEIPASPINCSMIDFSRVD